MGTDKVYIPDIENSQMISMLSHGRHVLHSEKSKPYRTNPSGSFWLGFEKSSGEWARANARRANVSDPGLAAPRINQHHTTLGHLELFVGLAF
jgi:hypothetical protein